MAAKRIVPSSDALRALRSLVHSQRPSDRCAAFPTIRRRDFTLVYDGLGTRRADVSNKRSKNVRSLQCGPSGACWLRPMSTAAARDDHSNQPLPAKQRTPTKKGRRKSQISKTEYRAIDKLDSNQPVRGTPPAAATSHPRWGAFGKQDAHIAAEVTPDPVRSGEKIDHDIRPCPGPHPLTPAQTSVVETKMRLIVNTRYNDGPATAATLVAQMLDSLAATGDVQDWRIAEHLYFRSCKEISQDYLREVRDSLVERYLQQEPPRYEVVGLLVRGPSDKRSWSYQHCGQYLRNFCGNHQHRSSQRQETRKLLLALQYLGVPPSAELLFPYIRRLVDDGDVDLAKRELDHFGSEFNLPWATIPLCTELVKGYGRLEQWSSMDTLFSELHAAGISRTRPRSFANLFRLALHLFAAYNKNSEEMYDFLLYHMVNCGIVPTTRLNGEVLRLFVRRKRFDLIAKWMKDRQEHFPTVLNPSRDPLVAYEMTSGWAASDPSCHDILSTCKALVRGAVRVDFNPELKYLVLDAVKKDVMRRAHLLHREISRRWKEMPSLTGLSAEFFGSVKDHRSALDYALWVLKTPHSLGNKRSPSYAPQILRWELQKTLRAAHELILLMQDFNIYCRRYGNPDLPANASIDEPHDALSMSTVRQTGGSLERSEAPNARARVVEVRMGDAKRQAQHFRDYARPIDEIITGLEDTYQALQERNQKITNESLLDTIIGLLHFLRDDDVLTLLHHFYRSKWADRIFTRIICHVWIRTAMITRDARALTEALWSIVDSMAPELVHPRLLVLIRLAQADIARASDIDLKRKLPKAYHQEIEYLKTRVYRLHWMQMGCPTSHNIGDHDSHMKEWRRNVEMGQGPGTAVSSDALRAAAQSGDDADFAPDTSPADLLASLQPVDDAAYDSRLAILNDHLVGHNARAFNVPEGEKLGPGLASFAA